MENELLLQAVIKLNNDVKNVTPWNYPGETMVTDMIGKLAELLDEFYRELYPILLDNPSKFCGIHRNRIIDIYQYLCRMKEHIHFDPNSDVEPVVNSVVFNDFYKAISKVRNSLKESCGETEYDTDDDCNA